MTRGLVGIPTLKGGRDERGADCWGIVCIAYRNAGIDLPTYGDISNDDLLAVARAMTGESDRDPWYEVNSEDLQPLDVVLMSKPGSRVVTHVGVMVNDREFVHCFGRADSVKVPLSHDYTAQTIVGFRRHKELV